MMCADAGFNADQAGRQIGEPVEALPSRLFLRQNDRTALVKADDVE